MLAEPSAALREVREIAAARLVPAAAAGISLMLPGKAARSASEEARVAEPQSTAAKASLRLL